MVQDTKNWAAFGSLRASFSATPALVTLELAPRSCVDTTDEFCIGESGTGVSAHNGSIAHATTLSVYHVHGTMHCTNSQVVLYRRTSMHDPDVNSKGFKSKER